MIVPVYLAVAQTGVLLKFLIKYAQTDGACKHITDNNILIFFKYSRVSTHKRA